MRNNIDALRSLKKYTALALGSEWEIRLPEEEGAFKRPFCRVGVSTPGADTAIGARMVEKKQTFNLMAYPAEQSTPLQSLLEAERVRDLISVAFSVGVHAPSMAPSRYRAHPRRVPLYDYDGIALDAPATEQNRSPRDFMRVTGDPTATPVPDPEDDLLWVVTAEITLWWTKSTVPPYAGTLTTGVTVGSSGP